jgi:hypothetical protein
MIDLSSSFKVVEMHTWSSDWKRVIFVMLPALQRIGGVPEVVQHGREAWATHAGSGHELASGLALVRS